MDAEIRQAIGDKKLVEFSFQNFIRIAEPHAYGSMGGVDHMLVYQVRGGSRSKNLPKWASVPLSQMTDFRVLDETFSGKRVISRSEYRFLEATYAIVQ
jgi:hypothetical protein